MTELAFLEELIGVAIASGVEVVACQISMDLLGLKTEKLIDDVKILKKKLEIL